MIQENQQTTKKQKSQVIRLIWDASKPYRIRRNLTIVVMVITLSIDTFVTPYIIAQFLDLVQHGQLHTDKLWWVLGFFVIARLATSVIGWQLAQYLIWTFETAVQRDTYSRIFDKLTKETMFFHSNRFSGSLISQSGKLVGSIERFWDMVIWSVVPVILAITGSIILLWLIYWPYALFLLVLSIIFVAAIYNGSKHIRKLSEAEAEASNKVSGRLSDVVSNIMAVKSSSAEKRELTNFNGFVASWRESSLNTMRNFIKINSGYSFISVLITAGALIFAAYAAKQGLISVALIYLMISYTTSVTRNLFNIGGIMRTYSHVIGNSKAMVDILEKDVSLTDASKKKLTVKNGEIVIKDATFTHDEGDGATLFENFNLAIKPGEKIGLVGSSGSGKTTLTKLILRFADIDSGQIKIDDQDISQVTQSSLRQAIAYVPQEPLLFHRSILENIAYARPGATKQEIVAAAKKAGAYDFVVELKDGFDTMVGERGIKLSGGQRQRIAIARAILKDAPILILDEATSALDSESERLIQESLTELMKNRTSIVIAHRLSTIAKLDRIIVLDRGSIIEDGRHQSLLKSDGLYAKLWQRQSGGFIEE